MRKNSIVNFISTIVRLLRAMDSIINSYTVQMIIDFFKDIP